MHHQESRPALIEATLTVGGQQTRSIVRRGDWAEAVLEVTSGALKFSLHVNWDGSGFFLRETRGQIEAQHTWARTVAPEPVPVSNSA
jgi:hypothetical protein